MLGGVAMDMKSSSMMTLSSSVVSGNTFLTVRPGSNKTSSTLTYNQLMSFRTTVESLVNASIAGMYDVDANYLNEKLAEVNAAVEGLTSSQFSSDYAFYYSVYEKMYELYSYTLPSRNVEGRGIWHRPFESNLTMVRQTLSDLANMGINMLFVETFWMGRLIYSSQVPFTHQHAFTLNGYSDLEVNYGTNLLLAFVEEGKKYGIEVHAWVENFFVGYGTAYTDSPILSAKPEWISYNYDGTVPQKFEKFYLFMDPANPETREYLKAIYMEMAITTDIASIHLDYIRYPVCQNETSPPASNWDTGYSMVAEREFKYLYGYTGDLRTLVITNAKAAADWKKYKTDVISDFVAGVYYSVKNVNPKVYLSTAIFGNIESAISTKMQDWATWTAEGYIEMILPMAYYQSATTVRSEITRLTGLVNKKGFSYSGIAPSYMGYNDHYNTSQIQASINGLAQGIAFFATQNYLVRNVDGVNNSNSKVQAILKDGVFRRPSILPHDDTTLVMETLIADILRKTDQIYVPKNAMTPANKQLLEIELARILAMDNVSLENLNEIVVELKAINTADYANLPARTRLSEDITYLTMILEIKAKRLYYDEAIDISINPDVETILPPLIGLSSPVNLIVNENWLTWDPVVQSTGYVVRVNGYETTVQTNQFDLKLANITTGSNAIEVKALGDGIFATDSSYGQPLVHEVERLSTPASIRIVDGVLMFDDVPNALGYRVRIGLRNIDIVDNELNLRTSNLASGSHRISITAIGNEYKILNSYSSTNITYEFGPSSLEETFKQLFKQFAFHKTSNQE